MADCNVSAIAEHACNAGHGVDWNGVTILDQHKDLHPRLALEMFKVGSIVLMFCTLMMIAEKLSKCLLIQYFYFDW